MFKNYLLVATRNLLRNKSYVIINTLGLGIALACCISAYLLLAYNIEFDNFHADETVKDIYKIHGHFKQKDGRETQAISTPLNLPPNATEEIAGIDQYTRFIGWGGYVRYGDNAFGEQISFVDSTFFDMFEFPLEKGSHKSLKSQSSIFINEDMARKYFGDEDPIGKTLILNFAGDKQLDLTVGGVLAKVPVNTTFYFSSLVRIEHFTKINDLTADNWGDWRDPSVFVQLSRSADPGVISKQLSKYVPIRNEAKKDQQVLRYQLEHFKANLTQDDIQGASVNLKMSFVPLFVFTCMAVMILLIACFNLTNTSIALTSKRLKEVGIRKTVGAARSQIVTQFLFETLITIAMALMTGLGFAQFMVPAFTTMWEIPYGIQDLDGVNLFIALVMMVIIASLLAGTYPALYNSKFKPVSLLKGNVRVNGTNMLTHSLVAMQFALSVAVLVAGVMFIRNTNFQEKMKFGYDKEKIITVNIQSQTESEAMRNAIEKHPKIGGIAFSDHNVGFNNYENPVGVDTAEYQSRFMGVGENYFETVGFEFVEGRSFKNDNPLDADQAVIVNEAFLKKVGMDDPLDKVITVHENKRHIVGVVRNHFDNFFRSKEHEPFVFYPSKPKDNKIILVRAEKEDLAEVNKFMEKTWKELFPTKPYQSQFQEDVLMRDMKQTNGNLEKTFLFLTILGGLLSASGIFSLASLAVSRRTKEIGIRKALGASLTNVVALLNREFLIVLSLAVILGAVLGFYITTALMDEIYAYHITVGIIPVALCALFVFMVGILTTSSTILRAARANPVETLRTE